MKKERHEIKSKGIRIGFGKKGNGARLKIKCSDCGFLYNTIHSYKYNGKTRCFNCNRKYRKIIGGGAFVPLEKALDKIYTIRGYVSKTRYLRGVCSFPSALIGRKIKIQLAEDEMGGQEMKSNSL